MATRKKNLKTSQKLVRTNKIIQKGGNGNVNAEALINLLRENFNESLEDEINESQILYQNAKYYYSAGEYSGALVSFACASVLLNTIIRRLERNDFTEKSVNNSVLEETITKAKNVLNCCLISVEELQSIVKSNTYGKKDDEDSQPKDWEKICVKIQPLVFKKGSSNCIFYKDVIGLEEQKSILENSFVFPLIYPNLYPKSSKGILIYGPPGTGKTLLVKAAVNQLQLRAKEEIGVLYFTPSPGDLKGKYVGETEKKIEEWFTCASRKACDTERACNGKKFISIIFIDEIDSIARDRADDPTGLAANSVNTLLQMMDGINSKENVAVIGATNYPWYLDSAIIRRFDTQILIDIPNAEDMKQLLDYEVNRYLDLKLKVQTVCDDKKKSNDINSINADKCGLECEQVEETPHINDPFVSQFYIDYYEEKNKELKDPTKMSQISAIVNRLEEASFTNSDISRLVKTASRRAGELSIKCNLFYNTSAVGKISEIGQDTYMSSLTRIKDEQKAIDLSIEILNSFKKKIESNKIFQVEPPNISIVQFEGYNYYNMKCVLYRNNDMIISFPLLKNIFIKGEKIGEEMTIETYKKNILNSNSSSHTDIIMSFNLNFNEKTNQTQNDKNTGKGVQIFESQLVNVVYSSIIDVYDGNTENKIKSSQQNIPKFFEEEKYSYVDEDINNIIQTNIASKFKKININMVDFDFFSFLLLHYINNTENLNKKLLSYLDGVSSLIGKISISNEKDINNNEKRVNEKLEYFIGESKSFIQYKYYKKLIRNFYVYEILFPGITQNMIEEQYIEMDTNLFILLFNKQIRELPPSIILFDPEPEIKLIQLYLNAVLKLVHNYEKTEKTYIFSYYILVNFLKFFGATDLNKDMVDNFVKIVKNISNPPEETNELVNETKLGGVIEGGKGLKQYGGSYNDIMTEIFKVILQENYICSNNFLYTDSSSNVVIVDTNFTDETISQKSGDAHTDFIQNFIQKLNDKFNDVYKDKNVNENLYNFYKNQLALMNNTYIGNVNTKEIFFATSFNFNSVYELNKPNLFSDIGNNIKNVYDFFKKTLLNQGQLTTEEQKKMDNSQLMNELMEKNQLISVLFKDIKAFGFLYDAGKVGNDDIKVFDKNREDGKNSEKFTKIRWKNVQPGKLVEYIDSFKQTIINPSPELLRSGFLGYLVTNYYDSIFDILGSIDWSLIGAAKAVGALSTAAGIGTDIAYNIKPKFDEMFDEDEYILKYGLGLGGAAIIPNAISYVNPTIFMAYSGWLAVSNLFRFITSKNVVAGDIVNNTFLLTLLNIVTTVGEITIDTNKDLLDEVYEQIINSIQTAWFGIPAFFDIKAWSYSKTGTMAAAFGSAVSNVLGDNKKGALDVIRYKKRASDTNININYSLYNINIPLQAFYYALSQVKSSYVIKLGQDLKDYNKDRNAFLAKKAKEKK